MLIFSTYFKVLILIENDLLPPPMHNAATPFRFPVLNRVWSSVTKIRQPERKKRQNCQTNLLQTF